MENSHAARPLSRIPSPHGCCGKAYHLQLGAAADIAVYCHSAIARSEASVRLLLFACPALSARGGAAARGPTSSWTATPGDKLFGWEAGLQTDGSRLLRPNPFL